MAGKGRVLWALAGVAIGSLGLSACYLGNSTGPKVWVVGDSITVLANQAIGQVLAPTYAYATSGATGSPIGGQLPQITNSLNDPSGPPQYFVTELGTDDAWTNDPNWQGEFNSEISMLSNEPCVLLVNVGDNVPWWPPMSVPAPPGPVSFGGLFLIGSNSIAAGLNADMVQAAAQHPNFRVVDWNAAITANPSWLQADGIHPDAAGQAGLANLIAQGIRSC